MKVSEMNAHEKTAFRFVCEEMSEIIGGYENVLTDYEQDSDEYKTAQEFMATDHDYKVNYIYDCVMARADKGTAKHMRFAGTAFVKERISRRLTKWGY